MNHIYKTLWSAVHQQYVVTNEKQASHGKPSKTILAAAVAGMLFSGLAGAAAVDANYKEAGKIGDAASWESQEYNNDWGLRAMKASEAYALGFTGKGVQLGVMDSGVVPDHIEWKDGRITVVDTEGKWGTTGNSYPQHIINNKDGKVDKTANLGAREAGGDFTSSGKYDPNINDSHGTHCTGTMAAGRNGGQTGMHGVAFDANVAVANTNLTDDANYGPFQDYTFFKAGWDALVNADAKVINNSWGSNVKILVQKVKEGDKEVSKVIPSDFTGDLSELKLASANFMYASPKVELNKINGVVVGDPNTEWEYAYFKKMGGVEGDSLNGSGKTIVDAAYEAVKEAKAVQVFTTGNWDYSSPYYRANAPYFHPEIENNWLAVTALIEENAGQGDYALWDVNYAGQAKWWTVAAPGRDIYSTVAEDTDKGANGRRSPEGMNAGANNGENNDDYGWKGGTSMAAPHVSGAMGVLMQRYKDMDPTQVRLVMLSTSHHDNCKGWTAAENEVVDSRYGWGVPDLHKGMFGPAQLMDEFKYELKGMDIWSNDIAETALEQRKREDKAWLEATVNGTNLDGDYVTGDKFIVLDGSDVSDKKNWKNHVISEGEMKEVRKEIYESIAEGIDKRKDKKGAVVKKGEGTLVMTGHNAYSGETTVAEGTLLAFGESIGNGKLIVEKGGTFGLIEHHNDKYTLKGELASDHTADDKLEVTVNGDGKFVISAFDDVALKTLSLGDKKEILVSTDIGGDASTLAKLYLDGMKAEDGLVKAGSISLSKEGEFKDVAFEKAPEIKLIDRLAEIAEQAKAADGAEANENAEAKENVDAEVRAPSKAVRAAVAAEGTEGETALFEIGDVGDKTSSKVQLMVKVDKTNTLVADLEKAVAPASGNEKAVFDALVQDGNAVLGEAVAAAKAGDVKTAAPVVKAAVADLSDETVAVARNVLVNSNMNVLNTALRGAHDGLFLRTAKTDDANLWIDGSVTKGHVKAQDGKFKTTFDTLVIGGDYRFSNACKAGAFIGYGHDKAKNDPAQIKMDDLHAGIYAMGDIADVELTAVASYTYADRKINAPFYSSELSDKAKVYNVYGEAALPVSVKEDVRVTPYVGAGYMHVKGEDMSTKIAGLPVTFEGESSNVGYAKLGARAEGVVYHGAADVALKADAGYTQFFGDKTAEQKVAFGESASATVKTKKLGGLFNIGLGVNAKFTEKVEGELSYRGDFGKAINANGVFGSIKVHF